MPTTTKPAKASSNGSAVPGAPARPGYKPTKLGWLPVEWEIEAVGKHLDILTDFESNGSFADVKAHVRVLDQPAYAWYVRATDLENDTPLADVRYVDEPSYRFLKKTVLTGNEVLVMKRGEIGKVYRFRMNGIPATLGPNLYLVRTRETLDTDFLFRYLESTIGTKELERINGSTTLGAIYKDDFKALRVVIPSLPEQRRIATTLGTWDKAIATLGALIAAKQRRKQGLMQELLSGKRRFPGFKEKWQEVRLDKAFDFLRTTSYSRADLTNDPEQGNVAYIHYGDIHATYTTPILDLTTNRNVPRLLSTIALNGNTDYLRDGDLVIADASEDYEGVGASIELSNVGKRKVISGLHTMALRDKSGLTVPGFRAYMLREPIVANRMRTLATGSKVYGISKTNLGRLMLLLPSREEQQRILSALNAMDSEIAHLTDQHTHLTNQKRGLMQQLLTGAVRVRIV